MRMRKAKSAVTRKKKSAATARRKLPVRPKRQSQVPAPAQTQENAGRKWQVRIGPMETITIAKNAPLCQLVVQNHGPATVEVCIEDGEPIVLLLGKLSIASAYGRVSVASLEENWATVEMEFLPRTKSW